MNTSSSPASTTSALSSIPSSRMTQYGIISSPAISPYGISNHGNNTTDIDLGHDSLLASPDVLSSCSSELLAAVSSDTASFAFKTPLTHISQIDGQTADVRVPNSEFQRTQISRPDCNSGRMRCKSPPHHCPSVVDTLSAKPLASPGVANQLLGKFDDSPMIVPKRKASRRIVISDSEDNDTSTGSVSSRSSSESSVLGENGSSMIVQPCDRSSGNNKDIVNDCENTAPVNVCSTVALPNDDARHLNSPGLPLQTMQSEDALGMVCAGLDALAIVHPPSSAASQLSKHEKKDYNALVLRAREHEAKGHYQQALSALLEASTICDTNVKLAKKVSKLRLVVDDLTPQTVSQPKERALSSPVVKQTSLHTISHENVESKGRPLTSSCDPKAAICDDFQLDTDTEEFRLVADLHFRVPKQLFERLYPYQRFGIAWLWQLHCRYPGGILGDDMGLGKTLQTVAFLTSLFRSKRLNRAMIVAPVSVVEHWRLEFSKWCPEVALRVFHGGNQGERTSGLARVTRRGGVLITTYGMVTSNTAALAAVSWDYVICDEGHKLKNPTIQVSKRIREIPASHRLLLTGTPVQNNLDETWALFDIVAPGVLGTSRTFKHKMAGPIVRANEADATPCEKQIGKETGRLLREKIAPLMLRRDKKSVLSTETTVGNERGRTTLQVLKSKTEHIIWVRLTDVQEDLYRSFLDSEEVRSVLNETASALAALTVLKKICDHPRLLPIYNECATVEKDAEASQQWRADSDDEHDSRRASQRWDRQNSEALARMQIRKDTMAESGKLQFLMTLLQDLRCNQHRTLIFSQSAKMLDIIQGELVAQGFKFLRIDGTVTKTSERQRRIDVFNRDASVEIFLLTTQVGGVGITLNGADRVVIFDPHWNPANDNQAVDRCYRVGQKREVEVYRLISCSTIEEKIYRNQVFKGALNRNVTESGTAFRYFTKGQLRDMFALGDITKSETHQQLIALHPPKADGATRLESLKAMPCVSGVSSHDLLYSKMALEDEQVMSDGVRETIADEFDRATQLQSEFTASRTPTVQSRQKKVFTSGSNTSSGNGGKRGAMDLFETLSAARLHNLSERKNDTESSALNPMLFQDPDTYRDDGDMTDFGRTGKNTAWKRTARTGSNSRSSPTPRSVERIAPIEVGSIKTPERTCEFHHRQAKPFRCQRCRCYVNATEVKTYNDFVHSATAKLKICRGNGIDSDSQSFATPMEMENALEALLQALVICDDDKVVHNQAIVLATKLRPGLFY